MEPSTIFSIANTFVLPGWLLLLFVPKWKHTLNLIVPMIILALALSYVFLILPTILQFNPDAFSTLENVKSLFQDDRALTAGWIHYLAFDLFVGSYIVKEGISQNMSRWQYTVCLPFTFMFGPMGLLLFMGLRLTKKQSIAF